MVSANQAFGLTDGSLRLGDKCKYIRLSFNPSEAALLGQLIHQPVDDTWFTRLSLSARELDDTAKYNQLKLDVSIVISAESSS